MTLPRIYPILDTQSLRARACEPETAARAWLDAELATLAAVATHTAADGWPEHATRLAATLFRFLDTGG